MHMLKTDSIRPIRARYNEFTHTVTVYNDGKRTLILMEQGVQQPYFNSGYQIEQFCESTAAPAVQQHEPLKQVIDLQVTKLSLLRVLLPILVNPGTAYYDKS